MLDTAGDDDIEETNSTLVVVVTLCRAVTTPTGMVADNPDNLVVE